MVLPCVVLNYRGASNTEHCLETLCSRSSVPLSIFLVDNGSGMEERKALARLPYPFELIALPENHGFSGGINAGIRAALDKNPRFVLLLNNDVVVHRGAIETLLEAGEAIGDAGIIVPNQRFQRSWMREGGGGNPMGRNPSGRPREIKRATAFCWLVKAEVLAEVGLLDENFFFGWEDDDFCTRVIAGGYRVIEVPRALVYHKLEGTDFTGDRWAASRFRMYHMSRGRGLYLRKHYTGAPLVGMAAFSICFVLRDALGKVVTRGFDARRIYLTFQGFADGLAARWRTDLQF